MITDLDPRPGEPITAAEDVMRAHLRLAPGEDDWDGLIDSHAAAARAKVEGATRRRLLTQSVRVTMRATSSRDATFAIGPVQAINSVTVRTIEGAETLIDAGEYELSRRGGAASIYAPDGLCFGQGYDVRELEIVLTVGYGDSAEDVPPDLLQAIRMLTALYFKNPEAVVIGTTATPLPMAVDDICKRHKIYV
ncbi:MAG: hypothetical protein MK142_10660 [Pseudomonadales bacterium]|nr:hypothetical protein [Pseudomonadales bacterium]